MSFRHWSVCVFVDRRYVFVGKVYVLVGELCVFVDQRWVFVIEVFDSVGQRCCCRLTTIFGDKLCVSVGPTMFSSTNDEFASVEFAFSLGKRCFGRSLISFRWWSVCVCLCVCVRRPKVSLRRWIVFSSIDDKISSECVFSVIDDGVCVFSPSNDVFDNRRFFFCCLSLRFSRWNDIFVFELCGAVGQAMWSSNKRECLWVKFAF